MAVAGVPLVVSEGVVQVNVMVPYTMGEVVSNAVLSPALLLGLAIPLATCTLPIEVVTSEVDVELDEEEMSPVLLGELD